MTGFGKSEMQNDELILSLELRTVNSRFLDFAPRLPRILIPYEDEAMKLVKGKCIRGRVTLSVKMDYMRGTKNGMVLNQNKLEDYINVVKEIQKTAKFTDFPTIGDMLRLPDIFAADNESDDDKIKTIFIDALKSALEETDNIRILEGENIQKDLCHRLSEMAIIIIKITKIEKEGRENNFQKYWDKIKDIMADNNLDENRIYQEAAILSEKKDITEEIVRFNSHMDLFNQYMNSTENEGKKLNFLLQEMSREVNTIGSKTDIIEINHLVVHLKDSLEKIREQVQNII